MDTIIRGDDISSIGLEAFALALILVLVVLLVLVYLALQLRHDLHMLQQNSYRNERYLRWRKGHARQERSLLAWLIFLGFAVLLCLPNRWGGIYALGAWPYALLLLLLLILTVTRVKRRPAAKKPLVMTARARRLYWTALGLALLLGVLAYARFVPAGPEPVLLIFRRSVLLWLLYLLLPAVSGHYLLLVNIILQPLERAINNRYLNEAKQKLAAWPSLKTIGITGSYGKTSSKMMLAAMLGEQYITLATPESVNTPMGITRIIREQLKPIHQVFISEMGAKQRGDIQELCELVQPKLGLLTAIGEQHLETFGSLEAIAETKFELIRALPADGVAVLNLDNPEIAARVAQAPCRVLGYGLAPEQPYHAEDIHYSAAGLSFTLVTPDGERQEFQTKLLGQHNVLNIVGAAAAAQALGVPLSKAAQAMRRFEPIPHRLQLLKGPGYTIIDDAFNANPEGSAAALEVLAQMREGKRILVTPGMVELGERQAALNRELARKAAACCDYIVLVGKKHSLPLQEGLAEADYPVEQTAVVADLQEARRVLARVVQAGDTVLFENDLPDTYNEA